LADWQALQKKITMKKLIAIFICLLSLSLTAQVPVQVVRGRIIDKVSEQPLPGAAIVMVGSDPPLGAVADVNGNYTLKNIPAGRRTFIVQFLGYQPQTISEVLVTAGKEVQLDVVLEESVRSLKTVEITGDNAKDQANNEFAAMSARSFSLEEVTRFSGGRNDPSRLAANFAGVATTNDARNDIVVRGNSPAAVLWRLEGIPIPNPNHFATLGTTGGPVSALNTNLLRNSDFFTGAFPAEYGNVMGAVFDVGFRSGNTEKREYTAQLNMFSGVELMAEGPISREKGSSYLVSYRYSFAAIGQKLGLPIGTNSVPVYQDISMKIDLGNTKSGRWSIFGIGGWSSIDFLAKDVDSLDLFAQSNQDAYARSRFGVIGLRHLKTVGTRGVFKTVLSGSLTQSKYDQYNFYGADTGRTQTVEVNDRNNALRLSSYYQHKFSASSNLRAGITGELFIIDALGRDRSDTALSTWNTFRDVNRNMMLLQPFIQYQQKFTEALTLNAGLHAQWLDLNNTYALEPRVNLAWRFLPLHTITAGYGMHSQMQPMPVYFFRRMAADGVINTANEQLDFTRAHHYVLAYDYRFAESWRLKAEFYYQQLYDAPVDAFSSTFSMLNAGADFIFPDRVSLVNQGKGDNRGLELTVEKFFSRGFYMLLTGSFFESRYKGSDGIWRNTAFNNRYVSNLLVGREIKIGASKRNALTFDSRVAYAGGRYYTPINKEASKMQGREVLDESRAYSMQLPDYFRFDFRVGFRINSTSRKRSQTFYLDFQNLTNHKNVFTMRYNERLNDVKPVYQIGFFPDLMYRLQF
jgi:hypothetical protein